MYGRKNQKEKGENIMTQNYSKKISQEDKEIAKQLKAIDKKLKSTVSAPKKSSKNDYPIVDDQNELIDRYIQAKAEEDALKAELANLKNQIHDFAFDVRVDNKKPGTVKFLSSDDSYVLAEETKKFTPINALTEKREENPVISEIKKIAGKNFATHFSSYFDVNITKDLKKNNPKTWIKLHELINSQGELF